LQWGNLKEGDHLEDLGVGERIILEWFLNKPKLEGVDWNNLIHDKNM
jgi:hypothetical protein